jgi:hypothetical protein
MTIGTILITRLIINILHIITGIVLVNYFNNDDDIVIYVIVALFAWIITNNYRLNIIDYYSASFNIDTYTKLIKIWHILVVIFLGLLYYQNKMIIVEYNNKKTLYDRLITMTGIYMVTHHGYRVYQKYLYM